MRARVLFFGILKDLVGRSAEEIDLPEGAHLGAVFDSYAARYPRFGEMSASILAARNQEFAELSAKLSDGDEVAFLPPVSGGCGPPWEISEGRRYFALTRSPIDTRGLIARLMTGAEGAVVTFEGTVRNHTGGRATLCLDYECYESMALKLMDRLGGEIAVRHDLTALAMVHRLGRMLIGETSVVVIAMAAHRRAAFDAALEAINRLKKQVPIWKKEHFVDGAVWVEGEWDRDLPAAREQA